jgi:hypothetical protein
MEKLNMNSEKRPIGVFASLMAGFDRIAGNPILIIPPLLLDLYLWFGPHLKISTLITQFMTDVYRTPGVESLNSEQLVFLRESMTVLAERYNLFSSLSSVPAGMPFNIMFAILASFLIGLPSLMALRMPVTTPLGLPISYDLQDPVVVVSLWLVFGLVGLGLGGLYHRNLAKQLAPETNFASGWTIWIRLIILAVLGYLVVFIFFTASALIGGEAGIMYVALPIAFIAGMYLAFTPHGIVRFRYGIFKAIRESVRLVRWNFFPAVSYIFIAFMVMWVTTTQIWVLPDEDSWFMLLAMLGHAFLSATLLAGSYAFFQGRHSWLTEGLTAKRVETLNGEPSEGESADT